ncbi:MAG: sigma-54-dependent Fis family transcriptional regulator [Crocinitomicaceae bacterium]|jgi:transcriptional regulator with PAS, ATPase and Fis domain|nr:sigma-54-dependent Fis family transcriptional regulator [Crocinitomicaceae bacterium]MBT5402630.1 sigma-54-dependent Fis family transcriptional regulator [Crocinitomicaceae bacterium]MBT6030815.1 sigma-54-dependent Fis family transcriptional regulator [Crocinitomicaceae bacterium]MBT6514124.1 sigma-54-dependent Fis family transcriptional regulator [Crocinitomicaceae bacterium]MDG2330010.1 sigma-54 dependent transcriptional regulator [Flavobacteriales bacterium]
MTIQQVKQRFGIIGNSIGLNRALDVALQVAPTDISVFVTGESGSGKESMPQVIHHYSSRKHAEYIAVNCGAIPEGTIDSELFGHEKGSFTGATGERKGYFEVANGGTIFLDEVAELPLQTQVRLLRVLETGEFIKVGSSKVLKTDVRIIAATNENIQQAINKGKFREDLFYRLSTVPINIPPLRERKEDVHLLFRKFAADFAEKYRMPTIQLNSDAVNALIGYSWPGNIRQLKNITEQISVIEKEREVNAETLLRYLPEKATHSNLPMVIGGQEGANNISGDFSEREILYKVLFDLRQDMTEMKKLVIDLLENDKSGNINASEKTAMISRLHQDVDSTSLHASPDIRPTDPMSVQHHNPSSDSNFTFTESFQEHEEVEESLSLEAREVELIKKALDKHNGKRKYAARELGISERTLYRKIKEYDINK